MIQAPEESKYKGLWRLKKAVYGLKDAAKEWYESLKNILEEEGGIKSKLEHTLFIWKKEEQLIGLIGIHVDDLLYGGTEEFEKEIIKNIEKRLQIGSKEEKEFRYLGIDIKEESNGDISLNQKDYVDRKLQTEKILEKNNEKTLTEKDQTKYRSVLGKLNWLAQNTRPDLCYSVSKLGRNMQIANYGQLKEIMKIGRKTKEKGYKVKINKLEGRLKMEIYADASFGNVEGGKTQIGFIILIKDEKENTCPIIWKSKVAKRVVSSTLAAETLSVNESLEWAEYINKIWREIHGNEAKMEVVIKTDCKSLKDNLDSKAGVKNRMPRIELASLNEKINDLGIAKMKWIGSEEQLADGFTKENKDFILKEMLEEI